MQNNAQSISILQSQIMQNEILPSYNKEIKDGLAMRIYWDKMSTRFFTASISFGTIAGIIAFAAGATIFVKNAGNLTFLSGCCSSFGTACIIFSRHCESQCKESTKKVNTILTALGVSIQIPDIPSDVIDSQPIPHNASLSRGISTRQINNIAEIALTNETINSINSATGLPQMVTHITPHIPHIPDIEQGNVAHI